MARSPRPEPPQDKEKALDGAVVQIERQFGKGAIMRLGQDASLSVPAIPTGSLAIDSAIFAFCSTRRMDVLSSVLIRWMVVNISLASRGDRPKEGSSSSIILGSDMSPRPMTSICCSPPDSQPANRCVNFLSWGKRVYTFSSFSGMRLLSPMWPALRFSSTVKCSSTRRPSNT